MNIMFCGDKGVCQGIFMSTLSICKNTRGTITIYILTATVDGREAIPQSFADELRAVVKKKNGNNEVVLINITAQFQQYMPLANMGTRFTPLCMLRLFADTVPQIPPKILYLDTDVLCNGEFETLYDMDIRNCDIAGVPDRYGKWFFGNILLHDYLNSGVLLMNMANIRRNGLFEKCRRMCREKKMFLPDQSALNKLAVKQKIPGKYNNQGKMKKDTVFKHFTTFFRFFPRFRAVTIKPWQVDAVHNELHIFTFDDIIEEYQRSRKR